MFKLSNVITNALLIDIKVERRILIALLEDQKFSKLLL